MRNAGTGLSKKLKNVLIAFNQNPKQNVYGG